jgi:hypothetical protein
LVFKGLLRATSRHAAGRAAVEAAFLKTLKDPEFVAEAEKTRMT